MVLGFAQGVMGFAQVVLGFAFAREATWVEREGREVEREAPAVGSFVQGLINARPKMTEMGWGAPPSRVRSLIESSSKK